MERDGEWTRPEDVAAIHPAAQQAFGEAYSADLSWRWQRIGAGIRYAQWADGGVTVVVDRPVVTADGARWLVGWDDWARVVAYARADAVTVGNVHAPGSLSRGGPHGPGIQGTITGQGAEGLAWLRSFGSERVEASGWLTMCDPAEYVTIDVHIREVRVDRENGTWVADFVEAPSV